MPATTSAPRVRAPEGFSNPPCLTIILKSSFCYQLHSSCINGVLGGEGECNAFGRACCMSSKGCVWLARSPSEQSRFPSSFLFLFNAHLERERIQQQKKKKKLPKQNIAPCSGCFDKCLCFPSNRLLAAPGDLLRPGNIALPAKRLINKRSLGTRGRLACK